MRVGLTTLRVTEEQLRRMLEFAARENTQHFLRQLRAGEQVVRLYDAGVRYCPDAAGNEVFLMDAPALLEHGVGSCGSIAAYEAGLDRALAQLGGLAPHLATGRYRPLLVRRPNSAGVYYFHAVVRTPEGSYDPTRRLTQVCVTPSYA